MSNYSTISAILRHKGSDVWTISGDTTVYAAIKEMADKNVGALLVVNEEGKPVGIFSERDYARKVALKNKSSKKTKVREIISGDLITATPQFTVEDCMRLMSNHRIRHIPIMEDNQVAGIVSIGDIVNWVIQAQTETIIQLESFITGHYPE